jgi:hypothetical protein
MVLLLASAKVFLTKGDDWEHLKSTSSALPSIFAILHSIQPSNQILSFDPTMSHSADSQGWERFKSVIRALYIAKGHTLEGPDGVIKLMENRHGFKAT